MKADGESVERMATPFLGRLAAMVALAAILVAVIAAAAVPMQPSDGAESGTCGEGLEWSLDDEGALTITGEGYMDDYERCGPWGDGVRSVVAGDGVMSIGEYAFERCRGLVSASMPAAVTIGRCAFSYCVNLSSVEMPAAVTIEDMAFESCFVLQSASMPAAVTIGNGAFSGCDGLVSASMPVATSIGGYAFDYCSHLREVLIPASVESIGYNAFRTLTFLDLDGSEMAHDAESLSGHIYFGDGDGRLYRVDGEGSCGEGLRWVLGPDLVLEISGEGYMDGYMDEGHGPWGVYVREVVAGEGVRSVGAAAFHGCGQLESASFPGAEAIGDYAFSNCEHLSSVEMPAAVSIGDEAFRNCCFESVEMPAAVTIGDRAFHRCLLVSVDMPSAAEVGYRAFWYCPLERVYLPHTLASLGDQAFAGLTFLDEAGGALAQDAESLRGYAYEGAGDGKLKRLPYVFAQDGVRYWISAEGSAVATGFEGEPVSLAVPAEVLYLGKGYAPAAIADGAFAGCSMLESISVGNYVAEIGDGALDCPALRSIEVSGDNAAYSSIAGVLYDRDAKVLIKFPSSKQRLVIPDTVEEIAPHAFENAGAALKAVQGGGDVSYLRYVAIPASVERIGGFAFAGSTLECLKFVGGEASVGESAFAGCSAISYAVFGAAFAEVGDYAFDGCVFYDGETEMTLDDALAGHKFTGEDAAHLKLYVPRLGGSIVSGDVKYRITDNGESKALSAVRPAGEDAAELSIPASVRYLGFDWEVTSVASKAFSGLQSLRSVSFGGPVSLGPYAFFGCKNLGSVTFGGEAALGTSAFSCCGSLADADLGNVVSVGKHAFYNCALTRADLSSAETIGYGAFTGNDLRDVAFSPGLESVDPKAFFRYSVCGADGAKLPVSASGLAGKAFEGSGKALVQTV